MRRTQTGRIVYDRPRHFFNGNDLLRVARAMPPPDTIEDGLKRLFTIGEIYRDITRAVLQAAFGGFATEALQGVKNTIRTLVQIVLQSIPLDPDETTRWIEILDRL